MAAKLPIDRLKAVAPPASPIVETVLNLVQDRVRNAYAESGQSWDQFVSDGVNQAPTIDEFTAIEKRILATGYRFAWSAAISAEERPEAYHPRDGDSSVEAGFAHPDAPQGETDADGRALRGAGDNVVRQDRDQIGIARYIRDSQRVLAYLNDGVPEGTIAVIDDSGGTLTAPIIEQFAGIICAGGTVRSHLGILSREYNIPCLMNAKLSGIADGDRVMIESSAAAKTTEDYQSGTERVGRIWLLAPETTS